MTISLYVKMKEVLVDGEEWREKQCRELLLENWSKLENQDWTPLVIWNRPKDAADYIKLVHSYGHYQITQ